MIDFLRRHPHTIRGGQDQWKVDPVPNLREEKGNIADPEV